MQPDLPPRPPSGPACWLGPDLEPEAWVRRLKDRELELLVRLAARLDLDDPATAIDLASPAESGLGPESAAPSELVGLAGELRSALLDGPGFVVVRGLPVADLDLRTVAAIYLVLGRLLGGLRSQNAEGHLLGHVRNVGADPVNPSTRIYQTNRRQSFHTDSCDTVGLLCLQPAREGGRSLLVSAEAVYRRLVERAPDHAPRLFEPVATDRRGEVPPSGKPWFEIPVLSWYHGHLTPLYQRQYIDSAARFDQVPPLEPETVRALDLFDAIMNDPTVHLEVGFAPGDIQFVNNHALLHDRTAFVDQPGKPRHLLRLWLTLPGARPLPPTFAQRYGSTTVGDRGGIVCAGTRESILV